MGFLSEEGLGRLVEKLSDGSNIKIAGNPNGTRVSAVVDKLVEKTDTITGAVDMEIENTEGSFKVGTGLGSTDVSATVEDGFSEVDIKGNTYQNILDTNNISFPLKLVCGEPHFHNLTPNKDVVTVIAKLSGDMTYRIRWHIGGIIKDLKCDNIMILKFENYGEASKISFGIHPPYTEGVVLESLMVLQGDHTNNPNLPSYFEGIVGVGDKSKNLFNPTTSTVFLGRLWNGNIESEYVSNLVKENDKYSFTITGSSIRGITFKNISVNLKGKYTLSFYMDNNCNHFYNINLIKNGVFVKQIGSNAYTSKSNNISYITFDTGDVDFDEFYFTIGTYNPPSAPFVVNISDIQLKYNNNIFTPYEPYYDGHKIEILSCGKNLLDVKGFAEINNYKLVEYKGKVGYKIDSPKTYSTRYFKTPILLKPNVNYQQRGYVAKVDYPSDGSQYVGTIMIFESGRSINLSTPLLNTSKEWQLLAREFSVTRPEKLIGIQYYRYSDAINYIVDIDSYGIYEVPKDTVVAERSFYDKTQILLDEPLMKLPNGMCDEIAGNKLIRRIGKLVLDGSEKWTRTNADDVSWAYECVAYRDLVKTYNKNSFIFVTPLLSYSENCYVGGKPDGWFLDANKDFWIRLRNDKLSVVSNVGFKQWLQENPITVYYELATPVVTELSTPKVKLFKDGHLTFNTLVAPKSTHRVLLNKSAQIEQSVREIQSLERRVGKLESFYDDMILETSHKLSLLDLDFDYVRESEEV